MASLTHTTSTPIPSTAESNLDQEQTGARANQDRQFWIGGLPNDAWLCVLDHLCHHCHPGPVLRPHARFVEAGELPSQTQARLPAGSRDALQAMTLTCSLFRELAQKYIAHCVVRHDVQNPAFLRTMRARPDLAGGVRKISVSSATAERSILGLCTNVQALNYIIPTQLTDSDEFWSTDSPNVPDVKFGDTTLVGKLKRLRELSLLPSLSDMFVDLTRGRLWLETLMKAAPELRTLVLHCFVDFRLSERHGNPPSPDLHIERARFPGYTGLPENKITRLELRSTYFHYHTLEQLLRSLKHLRDFKLSYTRNFNVIVEEDKTARPVDGHDGK